MFNYEEYMGNKYNVTVAAPEIFFQGGYQETQIIQNLIKKNV